MTENKTEDVEEIESEELDKPEAAIAKEKKNLTLVQDINGFCIYRASCSFVVKKPGDVFGGYFTTLGACVREIANIMLTDKAVSRDHQTKKNIDSLIGIIDQHTSDVERIVSHLDEITVAHFKEKEDKKKKKAKCE